MKDSARDSASDIDKLYADENLGLRRVAYLITYSHEAAEEAVHDGFVAVIQHWETLESPGAYLRSVVVRAALRQRERRNHERGLLRRSLERPGDPPGIDEMRDALDLLPIRQRAALVLRFYCDMSTDEVANAMGCRPATARSLIRRGLSALRKDVRQWMTN